MITANALTKSYRGTSVVRDITFDCAPGTVTGFLGPNGAGKSTTLRMITGLTHPDSGRSTIAGHAYRELGNPLRTVGTLLDCSAMHPGRSGWDTVAYAARVAGVDTDRVDELMARVGLSPQARRRRVGAYSLGMRQRLGLAQALVGDPQVLILDEPANGLDPEGIAWMRTLLRGFAAEGGTVLLSSHLLSEVQATVDHLVVIAGGTIAAAGPLEQLLSGGGMQIRATDYDALEAMLRGAGLTYRASGDGAFVVDTRGGVTAEALAGRAVAAGVLVTELRAVDGRLEDLFFTLTSHDIAA